MLAVRPAPAVVALLVDDLLARRLDHVGRGADTLRETAQGVRVRVVKGTLSQVLTKSAKPAND